METIFQRWSTWQPTTENLYVYPQLCFLHKLWESVKLTFYSRIKINDLIINVILKTQATYNIYPGYLLHLPRLLITSTQATYNIYPGDL